MGLEQEQEQKQEEAQEQEEEQKQEEEPEQEQEQGRQKEKVQNGTLPSVDPVLLWSLWKPQGLQAEKRQAELPQYYSLLQLEKQGTPQRGNHLRAQQTEAFYQTKGRHTEVFPPARSLARPF